MDIQKTKFIWFWPEWYLIWICMLHDVPMYLHGYTWAGDTICNHGVSWAWKVKVYIIMGSLDISKFNTLVCHTAIAIYFSLAFIWTGWIPKVSAVCLSVAYMMNTGMLLLPCYSCRAVFTVLSCRACRATSCRVANEFHVCSWVQIDIMKTYVVFLSITKTYGWGCFHKINRC